MSENEQKILDLEQSLIDLAKLIPRRIDVGELFEVHGELFLVIQRNLDKNQMLVEQISLQEKEFIKTMILKRP